MSNSAPIEAPGNDVAARLGRVPMVRQEIAAAGRSWQIDAVADQDALLAAADHFDAFPYGLLLWEASIAVADALIELGPLAGRRVLELGAGVGLAGLAARHLGADVVQTDHAPEALEMCRRNAVLNGIEGVAVEPGDWCDWNGARLAGPFDLILGADVLYDGSAHAAIARVLDASLAAGGIALLSDPGRTATPFFTRDMRAAGWHVGEQRRRVAALHPLRPGETVDVTLLRLSR